MPVARKREREVSSKNRTTVERRSDLELIVTRTFDGPARIVFAAWTTPDLLKRWWAPCSLGVTLLVCEADVRVGGRYRYVFGQDARHPVVFSGTYTEVTPHSRLVYTQVFEPMREAGEAIITATFDETDGQTRLVLHERYPSKEALDGAIASGVEYGIRETMEQLEALVAAVAVVSEVDR
jgi:uncharacterized protein YndB with AHSA1/START domain